MDPVSRALLITTSEVWCSVCFRCITVLPTMKLDNPGVVLYPVVGLLISGIVEVRGFMQHAGIPKCGATSSTAHQKGLGRASSAVSVLFSRDDEVSRGAWVGKALGVAFSGAAVLTKFPGESFADKLVGEGGLPNGARQFSNLLKVQKDWAALGATIKAKGADVTPEEWKNVALFLRKVYQLGGDLEFIAGGFSPDKKKTALALVREIQKEVEAADVPARDKDVEAFLAAQGSVEKKFNDFMELFNDVPSEL